MDEGGQGACQAVAAARRALARSQYRVSVSPGDVVRLARRCEALEAEAAKLRWKVAHPMVGNKFVPRIDRDARPQVLKPRMQDAFDDAVGMLLDLVDAFPIGGPGHHLALSYRGRIGAELLPLVSAEREAEWAAHAARVPGPPPPPDWCDGCNRTVGPTGAPRHGSNCTAHAARCPHAHPVRNLRGEVVACPACGGMETPAAASDTGGSKP